MGELGPGIGAGVAEPAIADGFARPLVDVQETVLPLTVDIHVTVDRTVAVFQLFGLDSNRLFHEAYTFVTH